MAGELNAREVGVMFGPMWVSESPSVTLAKEGSGGPQEHTGQELARRDRMRMKECVSLMTPPLGCCKSSSRQKSVSQFNIFLSFNVPITSHSKHSKE